MGKNSQNFRVESHVSSLAIKAPCVVATNVNLTLEDIQTVNGVPVFAGYRVLVKNQTDAVENGIYNVAVGAWTRALDFDRDNDMVNGTLVIVAVGATVNLYSLEATDPVVVDTSELIFNVLV